MADSSLSIVGCGWLGLPLGRAMREKGWKIHGTTTDKTKFLQLQEAGIVPFLLKLPDPEFMDFEMLLTDYLVINMPPGRKNPNVLEDYPNAVKQLLHVASQIKSIEKIVFISSTSVYGNISESVNENVYPRPDTPSGKAVLAAEQLVMKSKTPFVILRFGGLAGPERHPGRFLSGRELSVSGDDPINYLHLEDAIGVIAYMLEHNVTNEIFNVVAPVHPSKKEFYEKMAITIGLSPPTFAKSDGQSGKEVSVNYLLSKSKFTFKYPDPMEFEF